MQTATGVVDKVGQGRGCSDTFYLRIKGNSQRKYGVCLTVAEGRALKGQEVTVWSQRRFATFGMEDYIRQIQFGDRLIMDYSKIKPNIEMRKRTAPAVIRTFLFLAFAPLALIWWANRKGPTEGLPEAIINNNNRD